MFLRGCNIHVLPRVARSCTADLFRGDINLFMPKCVALPHLRFPCSQMGVEEICDERDAFLHQPSLYQGASYGTLRIRGTTRRRCTRSKGCYPIYLPASRFSDGRSAEKQCALRGSQIEHSSTRQPEQLEHGLGEVREVVIQLRLMLDSSYAAMRLIMTYRLRLDPRTATARERN
jgi:hypothetical protein